MLSALIAENMAKGGLAPQEPAGRPGGCTAAYAPRPRPDGSLLQDPDFTLPSAAGPIAWMFAANAPQVVPLKPRALPAVEDQPVAA